MDSEILQKFTTHLKNSLAASVNFAIELGSKSVHLEFLLFGLVQQRGSIGGELLSKAGLRIEPLKKFISEKYVRTESESLSDGMFLPEFSEVSRKAIEKAALLASKYQHQYIGTEHLLYGIVEIVKGESHNILETFGLDTQLLEQNLLTILKSTSKFTDLTEAFQNEGPMETVLPEAAHEVKAQQNSALDFFCTHLTDTKLQREIDPVIGREEEIDRLIHILSRRTKNNPILIGEPGVGKTAIIEGLAKRVLEGAVPDILLDKKIYSLDLGLVIAGTIYRGEFEGRFKQIIDEIHSNPNIILFIDEIHTICGTGGTGNGTLDAANILKPALSKGHIRCIGATTLAEYHKYIESDAALERRFQSILVEEQPEHEVVEVLKGLRRNYEQFHRVRITDEAIVAAVKLSVRYIQDKFLPDKAIDLIDEAASKFRIRRRTDILSRTILNLERELMQIAGNKNTAVLEEKFNDALSLKNREFALRKKLGNYKTLRSRTRQPVYGTLRARDIAQVISRITKVPVQDLIASDKRGLLHLEQKLSEYVVGQEEAAKIVSSVVRRSRAGLINPDKPIASFIFMGPSGVGKTELAKVLARTVFHDPNALIRIDMSEFGESFNISKLIGAPAGYVGYKEGAKLTDQVKRKPYAVVLFDEIEKAHPDVFNLLLQILDEGHLTDATGRKVNFKNTIIIMTSNIGLDKFNTEASIGFRVDEPKHKSDIVERFATVKEEVVSELKKIFRQEFINRVDQIVVFKPLTLDNIEEIVHLQLQKVMEHLAEKEITLSVNHSVLKFIAEQSFKPEQGARAVQRMIQDLIESPLAEMLLEDRFSTGDIIKIKLKNQQLVFTK
ncbi:MAG: hypothetical protein A3B74_02840 [Candidatus Kerfeldbacteria bacterium RIFCSPHIGHO2_02_FULL_42_14]|uniref:Clp R domain-containing protein n=1 Tax=Candidatus Kerfeldbacteria bacterium RIFCSPHIGHO2_02_FULL_42_14 TaxID=1798540 RepID=A0A1G2AS27_9BACT|nr:MAG: hypothetical protein A3B74_02840 [Candidatus Kerfeldbacteria bacterium RIFCSPHIGHO2_02_FULL_42_14]OGY80475.1 MAG: hypothetical protein A3E60_05455 [Candidatus Kerfeldbacteria bacterium RIFCSPHIGHO2_12_FULL_42_13]OGY83905.1 MAG: hypothetical protein A3I91_04980 [Candidatus Kerfeldbacteria bacterium RIFCSPLOWO2_02_FULL_42_19]OGY86556.1 MAG: hypothetical protein A3G01_04850 [Candidatus Kerfeldbacteria bacterium RIFCSPLOWO2_12_FULL_43_9]